MKRTGFKPYVMKPCQECGGERPHTPSGACVSCVQRAKATTPGRSLVRRARALGRTKPKVSATKQAAKDALPIAQAIVRRRAAGRCECCGTYAPMGQHHHRKPRQAGGSSAPGINAASNLLWLLPACHDRIENKREWAYQRGLLVLQSADPAKVAVQRYDGLVLLADDGTMRPSALAEEA